VESGRFGGLKNETSDRNPARTIVLVENDLRGQTDMPHSGLPFETLLTGITSMAVRQTLGGAVVAISLVVASVAQQAPTPQPSPSQLPDAPSVTRQASPKSFGQTIGSAVKTIGHDEWHIITAPLSLDGVGFRTGTPIYKTTMFWNATVLTATGVLIANDESVASQVPTSWKQTSTNLSDGLTYGTAAAAGGIYVAGLITHDDHAQRTGVLSAEAAIDTMLLTEGAKLIFNRQRPYTSYDGKFFAGNFSSGSFPSGHAAFTWTLASVIAHEYPQWPVQVAMYGIATAVATTRVTGGQHFPSDVFFGSTMGYLIGRYVANKDKHAQDHPPHAGNKLSRVPSAMLSHISVQ
jgi:membrane-associated phospholipid phosphatase